MQLIFYMASAIAVIATLMVITRHNLIHALLWLVVSFVNIAIVFYILGAPFMAALEMIIYAGAIVVLIIFVIMMLNLKQEAVEEERRWVRRDILLGPFIISLILFGELIFIITTGETSSYSFHVVDSKSVGMSLYGPYVIGVELCGILLMSGIVGAYHLGRQKKKIIHRFLEQENN
jgi:NADH-quinone oxidoreductase subunit J